MKKPAKKRVAGYWVYKTPKGKAPVTYYVKGYLRTRTPAKRAPAKRAPAKEDLTGELVRYTYKIECLVEYQRKYVMSFSMDKDIDGEMAIQYYHTKFQVTVKLATKEFKAILPTLESYGHIAQWMAIDLYRVSGVGLLPDKHWQLLKSYKKPEDVK